MDSKQISCLADFTGYIQNKLVMNLRGQTPSSNIGRRRSAIDDSAENPTAVQEIQEEERNGKFRAPGQKHVGKLVQRGRYVCTYRSDDRSVLVPICKTFRFF